MKIVCGALATLLFCVAGAIWYVYQKKAVFLPALFGLCGFPKIKESCYYDGSGHFRPATKEDKVGFFMWNSFLCPKRLPRWVSKRTP